MIKTIELIVVVTLMVFSFFVGVKYSDGVKSRAGWLFETKEDEVDLPDLTNENAGSEVDASSVYDNGAAMDNTNQTQENNNVAAPMDNSDVDMPTTQEVATPSASKSLKPQPSNQPAAKKQ